MSIRAALFFYMLLCALSATAQPSPSVAAVSSEPSTASLSSTEPISIVPPKALLEASDKFADFPPPPNFEISNADLWSRIRAGFALGEMESPLIAEHELWYQSRPEYIQRFVERGSKYLFHVVEEVSRRGMPMEIALLPVIESAFNPQAYSRSNAAGMWQFIPSTGKNFGLKQNWAADERRDVLASTTAALAYLQRLHDMFNSWELALAAYNCGEGCVSRAISKNERRGLPTGFLNLNLPTETRNYVPKLIAVKNIISSPSSYGVSIDSVPDEPYFAQVAAPTRIDIMLAARLAELPESEFNALNPSFNKPVASGDLGYFLVPREKAEVFRANLAAYVAQQAPLVSWQNVNVKRGESFESVGKKFNASGAALRAANPAVREYKRKFSAPTTIMVPLAKEAKVIRAALDAKALPAVSSSSVKPGARYSVIEVDKPNVSASIITTSPPLIAGSEMIANATSADEKFYIVQAGDTLFSISRRESIAIDDLKSMNKITGNTIRVGDVLRLSPADMEFNIAMANPEVLSPVPTPAKPKAKRAVYVVRTGDTLSEIADKTNSRLSELLRINRLTLRSTLGVGMKITLP